MKSTLALLRPRASAAAVALTFAATGALIAAGWSNAEPLQPPAPPATTPAPPAVVAPPAKTVALVRPKWEVWPDLVEAGGNLMPWQESLIGTEVGGLRVTSLLAAVGDTVKKGQVLARLNPGAVEIDLEAANAQVAEAEAALAQAVATLARANRLAPSGGVSQQELTQYETQKHTAEARLGAARAQQKRQQLRLEFTTLTAPDDGVISSVAVAEGAIVQAGSEVFRLIRQGRLEWRAEVRGETLLRLAPGQDATIRSPLGDEVHGRVRQVAPTINVATGLGLAYVDLPAGGNLKAGLAVSGWVSLGKRKALVLPASAVQRVEGSSRVFVAADDGRLSAVEVKTGRQRDDKIEIVAGLDEQSRVVARDLRGLQPGDLVRLPAPPGGGAS